MTQLLQLQRTEVLKLNSSSCKIQTLDLWDHGRCSTLPIELTSQLGVPGGGDTPDFKWYNIGMIEQGQKSKPKKSQGLQTNPPKIPGSKFNPRKIPCMPNFRTIKISRTQRQSQNSFVFILITEVSGGNYHESSDCFEYPRKSVVKSSYPKKFLTKFSYPKKSQNQKFQTPKSPWIIPVTWNPYYPRWAAGSLWVGSL